MNIHEYQAKALISKYGVATPPGHVAYTPEEAVQAAQKLGGSVWVVKAQIHAGGRGKAGGVKVVKSLEDVKAAAQKLLGMTLVTHQTGPAGKVVKRIYVEGGCDIKRELYLGMLVDRATSRITIMASAEGGVNIEEVAANTPEKLLKVAVDPATGIQAFHTRKIAFFLGLEGNQIASAAKFITAMYNAFNALDCSIVEINPLVVTGAGDVLALDAKVNFDDNALFRHKDVEELRDPDEEDPAELEAAKHSLNYIKLDGSIGCMVNGAGLAMATMDIIKLYGAEPANFLDVGGSATKEKVAAAFNIITSDPKVKGILVNIFGGIAKCDLIAEALVKAGREVGFKVPVVVRLEGTNVEKAREILSAAKGELPTLIAATDLTDAAKKVVAATAGKAA